MKFRFIVLITIILIMSFKKKRDLDIYLSYLVGDFDNQAQIDAEIKAGKQIHPFAKHITRIIQERVNNIPANFKGVFVLEESYYKYPDKDTLIKPYIFLFKESDKGEVLLNSMAIPSRIDKNSFRNSNKDWKLDFNELKPSPTFSQATYRKVKGGFYINHTVNLPNDMTFTLEETIGKKGLTVMETPKKNGVSLASYDTPIQYIRIKNKINP